MARERAASSRSRRDPPGLPACGYTFDGRTCDAVGDHYCELRADRVVAFFAEVLVHTKGHWARQAFVLEPWQEHDIVRPVFGMVAWSPEWGRYVRRYRIVYIVLGRKNGKSELAAGIVLYLLVGDDEEAAEVYGAAKDTKQAGKVFQVVERMRQLSPILNKELGGRLTHLKNERRVVDEQTASFYEVITSDAVGELGHNPHGFVLDELLSQAGPGLFNAMRTAMGTRAQSLMVILTTETDDPSSFGAHQIDEAEKIAEDPTRAPHIFSYVRKLPQGDDGLEQLQRQHPGNPDLPVSTDVWDERNWRWPNPALGSFLSVQALRDEALEARNDPAKENPYRQFRTNQRVQQTTRWMPLHLWNARGNIQLVDEDDLAGRTCFAGLDLASTTDLAAWVLLFPPEQQGQAFEVLWRFWTPEAQIPKLDRYLGDQVSVWVRNGYLRATEGDWIDYWGDEAGMSNSRLAIHPQIAADKMRFRIVKVGYDQKEATSTAQFMKGIGLDIEPIYQGFSLSPGLKELMRLVKAEVFCHGGHPVARWNADSAEVKQDDQERLKLVKPERGATGKRIDGIAAAANAIRVFQLHEEDNSVAAASGPSLPPTGSDLYRPSRRLNL